MKKHKKDKKKANLTDEAGAVDKIPPNLTDEAGAVDKIPKIPHGHIAPTITKPLSPEKPIIGIETEYHENE